MTKIDTGFIDVGEQENDFLLDGEITLPSLYLQDNKIYEYHQGTSKDCTLYSSIGSISDLMNYEFSQDEINDIVNQSYLAGRVKGNGRYTQSGVKLVCKRWNEKFPTKRVLYFRIDVKSNIFAEAINKGYTSVISLRGNSAYVLDYSKDGVVDGKEFKPTTYGHATDSRQVNGSVGVKDSYKGRTYNRRPTNQYVIKYMGDLVDNNNIYPSAYLILPENNSKQDLEQMKLLKAKELKLLAQIQGNSDLWYMEKEQLIIGEYSNDWLHECNNILRTELAKIQDKLKSF